MDLKPYVAIDTETTGLRPEAQVLQIAMIFDDLKSPIEKLEAHSFLIDNSDEPYVGKLEPVALGMNGWIYKEIAADKSKHKIFKKGDAVGHFHKILLDMHQRSICLFPRSGSLTLAGKNVQGFDFFFLKSNGFITEMLDHHILSHRMIDTGSLYLTDFGYVPAQTEINKKLGRPPVSHDAYDDAIDVVCAVRNKFKIPL
jgi:hypothetical protein